MSKARTLAGTVSTGAVLADGTVDASEIGSLTLPTGGDIVGTTSTQTLTNKTIDIASNTLTGVQASLVSGTSIKTVNSESLLGSGDVAVQPTLVSGTSIKTINGASVLGSGDLEVGGGGTFNYAKLFTSSTTFTPPQTGTYRVTVIGGGGSGATFEGTTAGQCTGGGAGGMAVKTLVLDSAVTYTVTIGAGGAAQNDATAGAHAGNAGSASSFSGTGITTIQGNGGAGGTAGTGARPAAAGGTASGGDFNITGGNGGATVTSAGDFAATGGGAVGWFGVGYSSGTAQGSGTGAAASGGAGVGGKSGDASTTNSVNSRTMGGSSAGSSPDQLGSGTGASAPSFPDYVVFTPLDISGSSGSPTAEPGFGSGGCGSFVADVEGTKNGNIFAGGGGVYSSNATTTFGGNGGLGGGGGAAGSEGAYNCVSGAGGDGLIIVEWNTNEV
jgi:hypothetical protein